MRDFNVHSKGSGGEFSSAASPGSPGAKSVQRRLIETALKLSVVAIIGSILFRHFSSLDSGAVWALIGQMGWGAALVLVPASLATLFDTIGWAACVLQKRTLALVLPLLPIRLGCDALLNSIPAGVAVGETVRPLLLHRRCSVKLPEAIASCLLAKVNMAIAQVLYILVVIVLFVVAGQSTLLEQGAGGPDILTVAGLVLIPLLAGLVLVYTGPRLTQFSKLLGRVRWSPIRQFLARIGPDLQNIDRYVSDFGSRHTSRLIQSLVAFVGGWFFIGCESFVILSLLDARVFLWQALSLEAVASLLRITFFFIPSALGAAEIAYATLIASFGVSDPITMAAAFIAVKRSRELLWIVLGYSTFLLPGRRSVVRESANSVQPIPLETSGDDQL
jgi:hypothetical protein